MSSATWAAEDGETSELPTTPLQPALAPDSTDPDTATTTKATEPEHYSPFVAYCTTVNYILGVGVIGMPRAFVTGGWLLSAVVLLIVSVMATFTALWYVEVGHRAARKEKELSSDETEMADIDSASASLAGNDSTVALSSLHSPSHSTLITSTPQPRRIEVNELIDLFVSPNARRVYEFLLCVYMMGSLWSYTSVNTASHTIPQSPFITLHSATIVTQPLSLSLVCAPTIVHQVFATGMAANVPIPFLNGGDTCVVSGDRATGCYALYIFYCFVFACIVVPIATRNLTEMKYFIIALAMLRFVAITCMVITTLDMLYHFPVAESAPPASVTIPASDTSAPYYAHTAAFNWSGLGTIFPICIFAQIFHHSVPGIAYPLKDKTTVPKVFSSCLFTMFVLYSGLSIVLALYFGTAIASQCTINWQNYTGSPTSAGTAQLGFLANFTKYLIVLFPPADVLSAFPLKAITVGNNIMHSFLTAQQKTVRRKYIPFRLFAAVTPILGALAFNDLTVLLKYTGTLGIVIAFLCPTYLQWVSRRAVKGRSGVMGGGVVERLVDSEWSVWIVAAFCVAGLLTVVITTILGDGGH